MSGLRWQPVTIQQSGRSSDKHLSVLLYSDVFARRHPSTMPGLTYSTWIQWYCRILPRKLSVQNIYLAYLSDEEAFVSPVYGIAHFLVWTIAVHSTVSRSPFSLCSSTPSYPRSIHVCSCSTPSKHRHRAIQQSLY